MLVVDEFAHEALEMAFVEDDHMIEQVATAGANKPLTDAILPWALEACSLGLDPEALDRRNYLFVEIRPTIKDQVVPRKNFI
jgi:hypothetical protein